MVPTISSDRVMGGILSSRSGAVAAIAAALHFRSAMSMRLVPLPSAGVDRNQPARKQTGHVGAHQANIGGVLILSGSVW